MGKGIEVIDSINGLAEMPRSKSQNGLATLGSLAALTFDSRKVGSPLVCWM